MSENIIQKIQGLKPIINEIDNKINATNSARNKYYSEINSKFDLINAAIQKILQNPNFKSKRDDIKKLNEEIIRLNDVIAKNKEEIAMLNENIKQFQTEIQGLKNENTRQREEFQQKIQELEQKVQQLQEENNQLKTEIQRLNDERQQISAALDEIVQLLQSKLAALDSLTENVVNPEIDGKIDYISRGVNEILEEIEGSNGSGLNPLIVPSAAASQPSSPSAASSQPSSPSAASSQPSSPIGTLLRSNKPPLDPSTLISIKDRMRGKITLSKKNILEDIQVKINQIKKQRPLTERVQSDINRFQAFYDRVNLAQTVERVQQLTEQYYKNGIIMGGKHMHRKTKKIYSYNKHMKTKKHKRVGRKLVGRKLVGGWAYESSKKLDGKSVIIKSSSSSSNNSSSNSHSKSRSKSRHKRKQKKVKAKGIKTKKI